MDLFLADKQVRNFLYAKHSKISLSNGNIMRKLSVVNKNIQNNFGKT